ncbi:hypothetical protein [Pseudomonas oryzihabitans]|nr:hypothetical protein [Pseudomonas psychrotolerans]
MTFLDRRLLFETYVSNAIRVNRAPADEVKEWQAERAPSVE